MLLLRTNKHQFFFVVLLHRNVVAHATPIFFGKFLTGKIFYIVDLGMKEYNQCATQI